MIMVIVSDNLAVFQGPSGVDDGLYISYHASELLWDV